MYQRVIPRDLFNESKLLKCLGQLSLLIHDGFIPQLTVNHVGNKFRIYQRESDGGLYITNVRFLVKEVALELYTSYNSHEPYPLLCMAGDEEIEVFYESGTLTTEFAEYIARLSRT